MNAKSWKRSRTLLFNFLALLAAAIGVVAEHMDQLQGMVPHSYFVWLAFLVPVANKVLRVATDSKLIFITPSDPGAPP